MASFENLETLRRRNKELVKKLKQVTEELQCIRLAHACKDAEPEYGASGCNEVILSGNQHEIQVHTHQRNERIWAKTVCVGTNSPDDTDVTSQSQNKCGTRMQISNTSKAAGGSELLNQNDAIDVKTADDLYRLTCIKKPI